MTLEETEKLIEIARKMGLNELIHGACHDVVFLSFPEQRDAPDIDPALFEELDEIAHFSEDYDSWVLYV